MTRRDRLAISCCFSARAVRAAWGADAHPRTWKQSAQGTRARPTRGYSSPCSESTAQRKSSHNIAGAKGEREAQPHQDGLIFPLALLLIFLQELLQLGCSQATASRLVTHPPPRPTRRGEADGLVRLAAQRRAHPGNPTHDDRARHEGRGVPSPAATTAPHPRARGQRGRAWSAAQSTGLPVAHQSALAGRKHAIARRRNRHSTQACTHSCGPRTPRRPGVSPPCLPCGCACTAVTPTDCRFHLPFSEWPEAVRKKYFLEGFADKNIFVCSPGRRGSGGGFERILHAPAVAPRLRAHAGDGVEDSSAREGAARRKCDCHLH